jgi:hypothetical protein
MTARPTILALAASLALAPALLAQDHAVPRGGGGGGGSSGGGGHPSPGVSSSGSGSGWSGGSSSGSGSSYTPSTAERRHPRAGTGHGGTGYYPGYPVYPGWGGGYYPGYWWPYYSFGWYGGYYPGYWGYPWGWGGGGAVYHYVERESGSVRVLVDPAEARVYVDGYYAGTVDDFDGLFQRLHVAPGRHEIALKLEGYQTHRLKVYVPPDSTVKVHFDMQKGEGETFEDLAKGVPETEARREREQEERWTEAEDRAEEDEMAAVGGRLELSVRPEDASVYVDGAFRGSGRETSSLKLAPGRHRIEIVRPGYQTFEREVEIVPGAPTSLKVELEKPSV